MAEWRNGQNGRMAEWRNGRMAGMAGIAGMKDGIMNVDMSERMAQWRNGRNGNQNIIKLWNRILHRHIGHSILIISIKLNKPKEQQLLELLW